ncbi:site-specific integrase [Mucilaginibacter sp.]|jgi:integrase/recombinase XerD|uniref:tyrosine-type recombinase/integrase n=1 Tax=Mucilaginibacter sp. TaxID=1882438 RepID=UPI003263267C
MALNKEVFISVYLDTRREKADHTYPVKIRVFTPSPRVQKLYPTKFDLTKKEFESIWETTKPRAEYKETRHELQAIEKNTWELASTIRPFNFDKFEKKLLRNTGDGENVFYQFDQAIKKLKDNNQLGTASNYDLTQKSLKKFLVHLRGKEPKKLVFNEITPAWLTKYEGYMINTLSRSRTTVSIYLRSLRTVFNIAISDLEIDPDCYPFGKRKYQVPAVKNVKKALRKADLKTLMEAEAKTPEQARARDFWFFSYICNGMNIKDIALLRYEDIQEDKIIFYRAKTINTAKADLRPVVVYLTGFAKGIIEKYGNPRKSLKTYIFPILNDLQSEEVKFKNIKNFTRFINQNVKKLAESVGITSEISTYWARHSFATNAIRSGLSMEFVSEAFTHSSMKTTQGYFAGFEDENKSAVMESLMDFDQKE